jgi:hypothetical protein
MFLIDVSFAFIWFATHTAPAARVQPQRIEKNSQRQATRETRGMAAGNRLPFERIPSWMVRKSGVLI